MHQNRPRPYWGAHSAPQIPYRDYKGIEGRGRARRKGESEGGMGGACLRQLLLGCVATTETCSVVSAYVQGILGAFLVHLFSKTWSRLSSSFFNVHFKLLTYLLTYLLSTLHSFTTLSMRKLK